MSEFEEFEAEEMQNISVKITSKQSEALSELQKEEIGIQVDLRQLGQPLEI